MLADDSDIYPAALEEGCALEDLLVPFGIEYIAAKEGYPISSINSSTRS